MWVLYGFLTLQWFLISDFVDLKNHGIGHQRFAREPRRRDIGMIAVGKALHIGWAIALPLAYHRWWIVLTFYLAISWTVGLLLATMFQLAHCAQNSAEFPRQTPTARARLHRPPTANDRRCALPHQARRSGIALVDGRARLPGRAPPGPAAAAHRLPVGGRTPTTAPAQSVS